MTSSSARASGAPVAIIGIGCRFPGGISDPASLWRFLSSGGDAIAEIPTDRMDREHYFDARPATPGKIMTRWGGYLERLDEFDAGFFGISPREAERLDPQQRLLCETAWEALEDAGQDVRRLAGSKSGVFVGQWLSDFEARLFADPAGVDFYMTTGSGRYSASGRISYVLGLRGPSLTLDTACSSSLAAIHLAAQSVRNGDSELALAGGVNVILQPHITIAYSQSRMMAPDGRCKFGDAAGDGYVRSEGAALVVLKALDRALADGDRVYAVVRGGAINNDGRSSGSMGTPSRVGQEELLRSAYRDAGLSPGRVGYIEAHGTGTPAGDPVELGALGAVLGEGRAPGQRAFVGSVKTNFGHTEGAAGAAGFIKATLALHHDKIPASLHCRQPNPKIAWAEAPFEIPRATSAWPAGQEPRVAGVSAFGIAGTNAHIVLEQVAASPASTPAAATRAVSLLPLSAKSREALVALCGRYADLLEADAGPTLRDVCWNAATRRTSLEHRAAFVAGDRASMAKALRRFIAGEPAAAEGNVATETRPRIAFVLPGQGAQWVGMGRQLAAEEPLFRAALERCDRAARRFVDWSLLEQLHADPKAPGYRLNEIDVIQPVLVALAIAYAELWRSFGIEPDAVIGHSMGEVAAAYLAGAIDLERAMQIICRRSALMRRGAGKGAMALVELTMEDARARLKGREDKVAVAGNNSPRSSVISGEPEAVKQVLAELEKDAVFCRLVKVDVASHSPQMEPHAAELGKELAGMVPTAARVPIYSTVLGRRAEGTELDAGYWARNLRQPVLFGGTVKQLIEDGTTIFVELGPHPVLLPSIQQTAQAAGREVTTLICGRREEPELPTLLAAYGGLWAAGLPVEWSKLVPEGGRHVPLPLYPWQRERHWVAAAEMVKASEGGRAAAAPKPDDESLGWLHRLVWEPAPAPSAAAAAGKWLVLAAEAATGQALAGAFAAAGGAADVASLEGLEAEVEKRRASDDGALRGIVVLAPAGADAPYLPLRVLQAVLKAPWRSRPRLWLVTRGAQATSPGARVSVEQAALWGTGRVIAEEHPELWGGLVDLDPAGSDPSLLARHLLDPGGEDQTALRGAERLALRLDVASREASAPPFAWRADAAYLITGGLGDIGLHVARALAARGVRRLVLLGRTALPPRESWSRADAGTSAGQRIAAVRALEAAGVAVHTAAVDVGDEAQVRAFLERYAAEAWPPIRGVIHAAGALDNHLAGAMDRRAFDGLVTPKLRGAQILDRLLPELDLFAMFSSTGAFLAQTGQANYAAANAGLDALALDRKARGLPALSVGWGVWAGTGLVKGELSLRNVSEMARQGIGSFGPERGTALFGWLCGRAEPTVTVLPVDWAAFRRARAGRDYPLYRKLLAGAGGPAAGEGGLRDRLAAATPAERRPLLEAVVRDSVAKVLKIAPAKLDARKAFGSMGLSSLLAMELRNRLEAALGRSLSATLAWNYPTVVALVDHLAGAHLAGAHLAGAPAEAAALKVEATAPALASGEDLGEIAELSDEEALLALRGGRPRSAP